MKHVPISRVALLLTLLTCTLYGTRQAASTEKQVNTQADLLTASFLVLGEKAQSRSAAEWLQLLSDMRKDGITEVIIQWLQYDQSPDEYLTYLKKILAASRQVEMKVVVGLSMSSDWWTSRRMSERFLEQEYQKTIGIADQAHRHLKDHPGFVGWYIPFELEAQPLDLSKQQRLTLFYRKVSRHLKRLSPQSFVAISGYKQSSLPEQFNAAQWWQELLRSTDIQRLYFQDGYGVHRESPLATSNQLLAELERKEVTKTNHLWVVIEAFQEVGSQPSNEKNFRAVPASINRLCKQIRQARALGLPITLYSYDDYLYSQDSSEAIELLRQWRVSNGCRSTSQLFH